MAERTPYLCCPLCESTRTAPSRIGDCSKHPLYHSALNPTIQWMQCLDCSHTFAEGYYTDEATSLLFQRTNANQRVGHAIEENRDISAKIVDKVLPYASDGVWLDIGFGNGSLLFTAQEYGFEPVGVDVRADNVNALKAVGIQAHCANFSDLTLPIACSVISMADVLEHMPFPRIGLIAAQRLLKDGGVLLISMPNSESIVWKLLDAHNANPYWGELEHYHNFSRTRLYALLRGYRFEPVRYGISDRYRVGMEVIALKRE